MTPYRFGLVAIVAAAVGCRPAPESRPPIPRLVVVIVVDQMRADYVDRFGSQFTGGLGRLLREGAVFRQAVHDHGFTSTGPGHATVATGVFPSHHGIVLNDWYERAEQRFVYAVGDSGSPLVESPDDGGRSPHRLLRSGLGDWLKVQSPGSIVYGVALKDRSAILMAGQRPDGAYWYRYRDGAIVTSTYYRTEYPDWVTAFNDWQPAGRYRNHPWPRLLPDSMYRVSREDAFPGEHDGIDIAFPHVVVYREADPEWFYRTALPHSPFADEYLLDFAEQLVVHEGLGRDTIPDVLFFGASAGDFIGHWFGPFSHEIQDHYLRLDRLLGELFALLDAQIGAGAYVTALTSDHGVLPLPEELQRQGVESGRVPGEQIGRVARDAAGRAAAWLGIGPPRVQTTWISVGLTFQDSVAPEDMREIRRAVADALRNERGIADAFTLDELVDTVADSTRPYLAVFRRSTDADRLADVTIQLREHYLVSGNTRETSHGSPYGYDSRVPVIVAGPGIVAGDYADSVRTVDLAPTLADLLGVTPPPDLDGVTLVPRITAR